MGNRHHVYLMQVTASIGFSFTSVPVNWFCTVSGSATATRQDSLLALLKLIFYRNYLGTVSGTPLYFPVYPQTYTVLGFTIR